MKAKYSNLNWSDNTGLSDQSWSKGRYPKRGSQKISTVINFTIFQSF